MADHEVQTIKFGALRDIQHKNVVMVIDDGDGFSVHQWTPDSVMPASSYSDKRQAASRVLQLLGTGPVAPQTHPEVGCIGQIDTAE